MMQTAQVLAPTAAQACEGSLLRCIIGYLRQYRQLRLRN